MARPRSEDPKRGVTLSLRASTIERIAARAETRELSINAYLSEKVEATFAEEREAAPA